MKKNNSKGLKVGDIVEHDCGDMGRVREVEYNDADECEVDWWGKAARLRLPRTSIIYLTLVTNVS
tara:strand:+ start:84 stop:278 length:195 start_codon:yes stop_codon:yes gene_type:complete